MSLTLFLLVTWRELLLKETCVAGTALVTWRPLLVNWICGLPLAFGFASCKNLDREKIEKHNDKRSSKENLGLKEVEQDQG